LLHQMVVEIKSHAAGQHKTAAKSVTAKQGCQVQKITANAPAIRSCGEKSDITSQCAQISGMIGQAFQLQRYSTNGQRSRCNGDTHHRFNQMSVGRGMADGCVTGERFHIRQCPFGWPAD